MRPPSVCPPHVNDESHRRDFLRTVGIGAAGLVTSGIASSGKASSGLPGKASNLAGTSDTRGWLAKNLILLHLSGGPSHIDTFDPKPFAAAEYRNLDPACQTAVPGVMISENLPRLAARLDQISLVRALYHDGPATHEASLGQLRRDWEKRAAVMLGQTPSNEMRKRHRPDQIALAAHYDDVEACLEDSTDALLAIVSRRHDEPGSMYGSHDLGRNCWRARMLLEQGVRQVIIHQFSTVYGQTTWDMHANGGRLNSTHDDYRTTLCPQLDQALSALLDDLQRTGLIEETIVVAVGEMGRTPRINAYGGRDHHAGVWTGLIAGGPIRGGQVIGASDSIGSEPRERPVTFAELNATLCHALGQQTTSHEGNALPIAELL